jgi:hypothetical protein
MKLKSKGSKQREENDGNKSSESDNCRKAIKCFYCGKLGHINNVCWKQLWDEKHNLESSCGMKNILPMINLERNMLMWLNTRRNSSMFSWPETRI